MLSSRYSYLGHRPDTPRANTSFIPSLLTAPRVDSKIRRAFPENPAKSIQALAAAAPCQLGVPGNRVTGHLDARLVVWERLSAGVVMMSDMLMVIFLSAVIRQFKLGLDDKMIRLLDEAHAATKDHLNNTHRALGMLDEELLP